MKEKTILFKIPTKNLLA